MRGINLPVILAGANISGEGTSPIPALLELARYTLHTVPRDMTTDRRFCRFYRRPHGKTGFGMNEVPEDGICLSSFVILTPENARSSVLLGKLNPEAPWDHIGALDPERVKAWQEGWMLPSSHLIYLEGPQEAATRIQKEQLKIGPVPLMGPIVVSEVYTPQRHPESKQHWDLQFIFTGTLQSDRPPESSAWRALRFIDTQDLKRTDLVRAQADILGYAGLPVP